MIGFYLSEHPLDQYKPILHALSLSTYKDLLTHVHEKTYTAEPLVITCGLIQSNKVITTRKGDRMSFAQVEDLSGASEVVIFPRTFSKIEPLLNHYNEFLIIGNVDISSTQQCKIKAQALLPLQTLLAEGVTRLTLHCPNTLNDSDINAIKNILQPGKVMLSFAFSENKKNVLLTAKDRYALDTHALTKFASLQMKASLEIKE